MKSNKTFLENPDIYINPCKITSNEKDYHVFKVKINFISFDLIALIVDFLQVVKKHSVKSSS